MRRLFRVLFCDVLRYVAGSARASRQERGADEEIQESAQSVRATPQEH